MKKPVELLPHFRADLLADLAGVLSRESDAAGDLLQCVGLRDCEGVAAFRVWLPLAEARQHALPPAIRGFRVLLQHHVELHAQYSRRVFGALQIPTHPIETVSYSRQHRFIPRILNSDF